MELLLEAADAGRRAELAERLRAAGAQFEDDRIARSVEPGFAARYLLFEADVPRIVLGWMLEEDDPDTNSVLYHHERTPTGVRCDIRRGLPFRPGREPDAVVPFLTRRLSRVSHGAGAAVAEYRSFLPGEVVADYSERADQRGLVEQLRLKGAARKLRSCREAADAIGKEDWGLIAEADREQPLPGYARWALCLHPVCPEELRGQLGGHDARFAKRLRRSGVYRDPAELVRVHTPARSALRILDTGRHVFPGRLGQTRELLAELAGGGLGGNFEAWAVLAQLLPTFSGTLAELIATSGAIAGGGT